MLRLLLSRPWTAGLAASMALFASAAGAQPPESVTSLGSSAQSTSDVDCADDPRDVTDSGGCAPAADANKAIDAARPAVHGRDSKSLNMEILPEDAIELDS